MSEKTMDVTAALDHLRESHPDEANWLDKVYKRDVVALGTDESYALRDSEGQIRCYKEMLTLSGANHGLVQIQGNWTISAIGYEHWADAVGASVIFPASVVVEGKRVENPYVQRDGNKIISVSARAIAFRFSGKGVPQASDWTTILDLPTYRMIDFLAKSKKFPQAFQFLPNDLEPKGEGTWANYPFDESTKLWLNTTHAEALGWLSTILNREKKAVDYAQTFAKRNALKHLSGLQKPPQNANTWPMVVYSWRPIHGQMINWNATKYLQLQDSVEKHIHGEQVQVEAGVERVEEDTEQIQMENTIDPEDQPETDEQAEEITEEDREEAIEIPVQETEPEPEVDELDAVEEYSDADKKIVESYKKAKDFFKDDEYPAACKDLKLDPNGNHSVSEMDEINKAINNMV